MPTTKKETPSKDLKTTAKAKKAASNKTSKLSVPVYSLTGKETGSLALPEEIFGKEVSKELLSQTIRVYLSNQKAHHSHTKTRGEVSGSTHKLGNQKGGGRARHGSIKAPIFVGGGIALGPKYRKVKLDLPKKMKKAALLSALSDKAQSGEVAGVTGLEEASGKTSEITKLLKNLQKGSVLFVTGNKLDNAQRAVKNLKDTSVVLAEQLNAYQVIRHQTLLVTESALTKLAENVIAKNNQAKKEN